MKTTSMLFAGGFGWLAIVAGLGACGSSSDAPPEPQPQPQEDAAEEVEAGPELPARICKTPSAASFPWFKEITKQVGLSATDTLEPAGTCVVSADFDSDGYPDLIALRGESTRGLVDGKRVRFLMMNRPDPSDPTGKSRVFVDVPDQAGLLATRDGTQDRGASIAMLGDLDNNGAIDVVTCPSDFTTNTEMKDPCAAFLNDGK